MIYNANPATVSTVSHRPVKANIWKGVPPSSKEDRKPSKVVSVGYIDYLISKYKL